MAGTVPLAAAAVAAASFFLVWLLSLRLRDASIVDVWWGPGFAAIALVSFVLADGWIGRRALVLGLVAVWGLRLGWHIGRRNLGSGEDHRYAAMRARHGDRFPLRSLWSVFGLQAALQWVISLPVQAAMAHEVPATLHWTDAAGVAIWLAGLTIEATADLQLRRFKADPANAGEVMDRGLWRYSRHPNYFGDALVWWGLFVVALARPAGWWTVGGPLLMTLLLTRISGVPLTEARMRETKPGFAEYAERTSAFLPLPPRRRRGR